MVHGFIAWLIIGAIAGWLAGIFVRGAGFGLIVDILVGIIGSFIGGWGSSILGLNIGSGLVTSIILAIIGAIIFLSLIRLMKRV